VALLESAMSIAPLLSVFRTPCKSVTRFAVSTRYPGDPVTIEEAREAVVIARELRSVIREALGLSTRRRGRRAARGTTGRKSPRPRSDRG
jgi:hypothetical protein